MRINVTRRDIDRGEQYSPEDCPIARAARRHFRDVSVAWDALLAAGQLRPGSSLEVRFELPDEAKEFIRAFDDGEDVHPFTFELREA